MRFVSSVVLAAAAILGLAACNQGPSIDLKNATAAEVAKAMKDNGADKLLGRPGKWSSTVKIAAIDTSKLPPQVAAGINAQIGQPRTIEACLTPEQTDHPERMLANVPSGCRYEHYKMGGGAIDGRMVCPDSGPTREMIIRGTYGKDQFAMTVETKAGQSSAPTLAALNTTMKIESHRVGDCDAKPAG